MHLLILCSSANRGVWGALWEGWVYNLWSLHLQVALRLEEHSVYSAGKGLYGLQQPFKPEIST
eukprot:6450966-Amphidinium_carterae.1